MPWWTLIPAVAALAGGACIFLFSKELHRFHKFMGFTFIFEGLLFLMAGFIFSPGTVLWLPTYLLYMVMLLAAPFFYYFATRFLLDERAVQNRDFWMLEIIAVFLLLFIPVLACVPTADKEAFYALLKGFPSDNSTAVNVLLTFDTMAYVFFIVEMLFIQIFCIVHLSRYRKLLESYYSEVEGKSRSVTVIIGVLAIRFAACLILALVPRVSSTIWFRIVESTVFPVCYGILVYYVCLQHHTAEELGRLLQKQTEKTQLPPANDIIAARMDKLIKDKFFLEPEVNLMDIADKIQVNSKYVAEYIKFHYGDTFLAFVNKLRIDHSIALMANKSIALADIAEQSGYVSVSTFYRNFTKIKGENPSNYRDRI